MKQSGFNETIPWVREHFLRIKPRAQFIWMGQQSMCQMADTIEANGGPAVIFCNDVDGPWGAVGALELPATTRQAEIWAVQSRAMLRNMLYFDSECHDCLRYYVKERQYERLQCHVRASWGRSRTWVEGFGFEQAGFVRVCGVPEILIRYEWRP
jgi:hypothetical protein